MNLNKTIRFEINEAISEEMGIADDVADSAQEAYELLENSIRKKEFTKNENGRCVGNIKFYFLGTRISLSYTYVNFLDRTDFYYAVKNGDGFGWSTYVDKRLSLMQVSVFAVSGTIVKDVTIDTIQHELEHIYQQMKMGKQFSDVRRYSTMLNDRGSAIEMKSKIGDLVYGCIASEQEGYINGLYSFLMAQKTPRITDEIYLSPAWHLYEKMKAIFNESTITPEMRNYLKENYGISLKQVEKSLKNFLHKIARTVVKVNKDKILKQGWRA